MSTDKQLPRGGKLGPALPANAGSGVIVFRGPGQPPASRDEDTRYHRHHRILRQMHNLEEKSPGLAGRALQAQGMELDQEASYVGSPGATHGGTIDLYVNTLPLVDLSPLVSDLETHRVLSANLLGREIEHSHWKQLAGPNLPVGGSLVADLVVFTATGRQGFTTSSVADIETALRDRTQSLALPDPDKPDTTQAIRAAGERYATWVGWLVRELLAAVKSLSEED